MASDFYEVQRFNQRWLWVVVVGSMAALLGVFGFGLFEQLILGRPWGDRPVSDTTLVLVSLSVITFVGALVYTFYSLRLVTEVRDAGVFIRFVPFRGTIISYADIQSCEARTYRPLAEYGGWGIKYGRSGKAYNMSGDKGAQLVLISGKRILIGSQRADELAAAINRRLGR